MAKILVADDNSNIQKMVGLALKDQGIDVVAVGNGEAAVRKISEIRPDLVLADVFMPVRNGYEVCQYVKQDPSLAHIPVILLVGAFDPLDEQEAQRVGADGVLKKPFVPPEPLISMVKSALSRAAVGISTQSRDKVPESTPKRAADMLPTSPAMAEVVQTAKPTFEEPPVAEEAPIKRPDLTIAAGDKTLAFGSLLDTPGLTEIVDDSAFVTAKPIEFDSGRNWGGGSTVEEADDVAEEEEEEDEASTTPAWRRDEDADTNKVEVAKPAKRDWRTVEPATARTVSKNPVDETGDLTPVLGKPLPSFTGDAWAAAITAGTQQKIATEEVEAAVEHSKNSGPATEPVAEAAQTAVPENVKEPAAPWISSPWEVDAQTTGPLASVWDGNGSKAGAEIVTENKIAGKEAPATEQVPASSELAADENLLVTEEPESASAYAAEGLPPEIDPALEKAGEELQLPTETVHLLQAEIQAAVAVHQEKIEQPAEEESFLRVPEVLEQNHTETADGVAHAQQLVTPAIEAEPPTPLGHEPKAEKAPEVDMEALVARVLSRMSPEALQAVTREILRPVLETIIRDEMNAKKP